MFLKNCWYVAAWSSELIDGRLMSRTICGEKIVFFKSETDRVVALEDRCCHRGALLSKGRREGECLRCMYHGLKFNSDGKCIQIPGQDTIPPSLGVRSFPVLERDQLIWVWMGEKALADPTKIVDFPYLRDAGWRGMPGYMHYDANYLFIVDNLSDFSHLAFVHTNTLGGSEEYAYTTKPAEIEKADWGFRVRRGHMNAAPPPFHKKVVKNNDPVDRWNIGTMYIPGIFFLETGFSPAGTGVNGSVGTSEKQYRNCQFITPETESSTHFFWNYLHNYDLHDPNVALSLHDSMVEGFMEDKAIIENQQQVVEADPAFKMQAIRADAPLVHFRWTLNKRIAEEQAPPARAAAAE